MHHPPSDADWLNAAARLALRGRPLSRPNPAVGALLVRGGIVLGRGFTQAGGRPHAEAMALAQAGEAARGATCYTTLEPCAHVSARGPSCADSLAAAGVVRVVVGVADPDKRTAGKGVERLRAAGVEVLVLDHAASRTSLAGYLMRRERGRPLVTLKLAISLDGCIAPADRGRRWLTGEIARAHVHARRALNDAILVGGATWREDAPRLDVRLRGLADRSPERWVLSRAPVEGARSIAAPEGIGGIEGVQYLYVEGGGQTAAAFLAAGLVDRIELYTAPVVLPGGVPAFGRDGDGAPDGNWCIVERRQLGSDLFTAYERAPCSPA